MSNLVSAPEKRQDNPYIYSNREYSRKTKMVSSSDMYNQAEWDAKKIYPS